MSESGSGKKTRSFSTLRMTRCWTIYWWEGQKKAFKFELNGILLWRWKWQKFVVTVKMVMKMVDDSDYSVHLPSLPMSLQWLANNTTQQMHLATQYTTLIIELKMGQSVVWRRRNARRVRAKKLLSAAAYSPPPLLHQFCSSGSIFDQSQHRPYSPQKLVTKFSWTSMIPNMGGITSSWCENSLNSKEIDPWLLPAWPHASVWSQKLKKPVPL